MRGAATFLAFRASVRVAGEEPWWVHCASEAEMGRLLDAVDSALAKVHKQERLMLAMINLSYRLSKRERNVLYTGAMGTALIPKVLSNMLTCVHNLAMGEAFMVGKRAGVDMRVMWDAIRASSGNSCVWETGGPMLMQGTYDPSFTIALQCKDNR